MEGYVTPSTDGITPFALFSNDNVIDTEHFFNGIVGKPLCFAFEVISAHDIVADTLLNGLTITDTISAHKIFFHFNNLLFHYI